MFTGIVEEMGTLTAMKQTRKGWEMTFGARIVLEGTQAGDSIAVNGTCLTVTALNGRGFTVGVSPETRARTNLEKLRSGDPVNLERAVTPSTRLGGHLVQGHVDGTGKILEMKGDAEALWVLIGAAPAIMRYIIPKGFICLDGVSLTVVEVWQDRFNVMLVPHTREHIILPSKSGGYEINIEVDMVGKYVEKFLLGHLQRAGDTTGAPITQEFLSRHGFS